MRRPGRGTSWAFFVLLVAIALLATACGSQGSPGLKGPAGDAGSKGAAGDKGAVGDKGPVGNKGATGDQGAKGAAGGVGQVGVEGVSYPTRIVVVPSTKTSDTQPAVVTAGARQPRVLIYGTGFPPGELLIPQVIGPDGVTRFLSYVAGSESAVSATGAFTANVQTDVTFAVLPPGRYVIKVSTTSGVSASAMIFIK
ncbi:MAG: collagen-like protein [Chloroflexi bacterium]|nr:collagen-like protein [Chloroflexota bacterium]